jgi:hypothetical protein
MVFQKKALTLIIIYFFCFSAKSQRQNNYTAEANAIIGTAQTPFWMHANKFGKVPIKGETLSIFGGVNSDYEETGKAIKWGYGANLGVFVGLQNRVIIQQAYAKAKWKALELYVGRREEIQGLVDTTLTSGSYIWSGNALPMPKIDLSIQNYTQIGRSGIFSVKGNYAHGWFDANRNDAKGVLLHQKSFYARLGKPNWKVRFYGGFNHQVQWGGRAIGITNRKFESSFKDYLNIIMGKSNVGSDTTGLDPFNQGNRSGNHLGTLDIAFELNLSNAKLFIYRQNIFEDGSLFYLNNITDGLNGFSLTLNNKISNNFKLNKITFEFLNTLSQGGPLGSQTTLKSQRGSDNYFNNGQYSNGWSYKKTSIGTPYIMVNDDIKVKPNTKDELFYRNNRIQAYFIGIQGDLFDDFKIESKLSFSKNFGVPLYSFYGIYQTSINVKTFKYYQNFLGGIEAYSNLSLDFGDLMKTRIALQFGFGKTWANFPFLRNATHKHSM